MKHIVTDSCSRLTVPGNGYGKFNGAQYFHGYGVGSTVSWHCNAGYIYSGSTNAVCLDGGRWSKQVGQCNRKSCLLLSIAFYQI